MPHSAALQGQGHAWTEAERPDRPAEPSGGHPARERRRAEWAGRPAVRDHAVGAWRATEPRERPSGRDAARAERRWAGAEDCRGWARPGAVRHRVAHQAASGDLAQAQSAREARAVRRPGAAEAQSHGPAEPGGEAGLGPAVEAAPAPAAGGLRGARVDRRWEPVGAVGPQGSGLSPEGLRGARPAVTDRGASAARRRHREGRRAQGAVCPAERWARPWGRHGRDAASPGRLRQDVVRRARPAAVRRDDGGHLHSAARRRQAVLPAVVAALERPRGGGPQRALAALSHAARKASREGRWRQKADMNVSSVQFVTW